MQENLCGINAYKILTKLTSNYSDEVVNRNYTFFSRFKQVRGSWLSFKEFLDPMLWFDISSGKFP